MGLTFIALQGFDSIAAVAGEVRSPRQTLPRAILGSLAIALAIYLPLLFLVSVVGVKDGDSISAMADQNPDTVIATAVAVFLGPAGWWMVMVAAVLAMLSALEANLRAASQVALAMGRDRTLPRYFGRTDPGGVPRPALHATTLCVAAVVLAVSDPATAGGAASLIFLLLFAGTHATSYLVVRRVGRSEHSFHAPLFPAVQVVGGTACLALATYQFFAAPHAAAVSLVWMAFGLFLYGALLAERAQAVDAGKQARDPSLASSRGHNPLVLVPVANPAQASGLVDLAEAIAPPGVGRVLLLSVVVGADEVLGDETALSEHIGRSQDVLNRALTSSFRQGRSPEAIVSFGDDPWSEIARIAKEHSCESLVIGLTRRDDSPRSLEGLVRRVQGDVLVLRAGPDWRLADVRAVLIPTGGRGSLDSLRARLLGSLRRLGERDVTFLRVLAADATDDERRTAERRLRNLADDEAPDALLAVVLSDDPEAAIVAHSAEMDLLILGTRRRSDGARAFGEFALAVAEQAPCATVLISRS
jgi:nucleotide-binding universal stress UspA family protein